MSRVVLTFKNNDKEKKIEEFLEGKVSPAGYLKELVWEVINGNQISMPVVTKEQSIQADEDIIKEIPKKKKVGALIKK